MRDRRGKVTIVPVKVRMVPDSTCMFNYFDHLAFYLDDASYKIIDFSSNSAYVDGYNSAKSHLLNLQDPLFSIDLNHFITVEALRHWL